MLIAFATGVLSFASPCVLPLVPAYIGHMVTVPAERPGPSSRLVYLPHALAFVAGWTPCIGPVLGSIIALAIIGGTVAKGAACWW